MFEDELNGLTKNTSRCDIEIVTVKCMRMMKEKIKQLEGISDDNYTTTLKEMLKTMQIIWQTPVHGHDFGITICNLLRNIKGLETFIRRLMDYRDEEVQLWSAVFLEQCLTADNCEYIAEERLLDQVLQKALDLSKKEDRNDSIHLRTGIGLIAHLSNWSEKVCQDVIEYENFEIITSALKSSDVETLRLCAICVTNYSMFGTEEHLKQLREIYISESLFNLINCSEDYVTKYYAYLASAFLAVRNEETEAMILKLGTLVSVESFLKKRYPPVVLHQLVESKEWLKKLVILLNCDIKEAQMLAAFYLVLEAKIQKDRHNTEIFWDIRAIEPLGKLKDTSFYALEALKLISDNVREWEIKSVITWLKHIGFAQFQEKFKHHRVNGDALLKFITREEFLREDIGMSGILSSSFVSRLKSLKKTYDLYVSIYESSPKGLRSKKKTNSTPISHFDIFISYRRSNGKDLASLLKMYLEKFNYKVFIDVQHLEPGVFDEQLYTVIENAKVFLLLLTPNALDRCVRDQDIEDWVHKEIAAAYKSECIIIPIMADNFKWPQVSSDELPKNISEVYRCQGMKWDHENQEGSINKLDNYIQKAIKKRSN